MKGAGVALVVRAVLIACIGLSGLVNAEVPSTDPDELVLPARVVSIVDGDTLKVRLTGQVMTVRLHGVDAPERRQAHGRAATKALQALAANRDVELKPVGQDRHERMVARVYVDGDDVNGRMVAQGYAWAAGNVSTMCPVRPVTGAPASIPARGSGGSVPRPRPAPRVGGHPGEVRPRGLAMLAANKTVPAGADSHRQPGVRLAT